MTLPLSVSEEKFLRRFDRSFPSAPFGSRLIVGRVGVCARRKGNRFWLYHRKKGLFSLFSLTLYGRVDGGKNELSLSFSRPRVTLPLWILWCGVLFYTGFSILFREPDFALWFLLPAVALLLPLFLFTKKEKKRLLDALTPLTEEETKE